MEIQDIKDSLDQIRKSKELWSEFAYVKNEEAYFEDENYLKRYALAIELQYDWTLDDQELVRFLMKNEVESRWYDGWQGIGPSLVLISYLLAKFKNPENVWLFEEAKWANFDTYCGYDSEFIFSAGVESTCNYLENHEIVEKDHPYLFEKKDSLRNTFTEKDIEVFLERMGREFPSRIEDQDLITLFQRAVDLGDYERGKKIFTLLESSGEVKAEDLSIYSRDLNNYDKAIYYQIEHLKSEDDPWRKTFSIHRLAELYGLNGDYMNAWKTANQWYMLLDGEHQINRLDIWFDISLGFFGQNKRKLALRSFRKGEKLLKRVEQPSYNLLKKVNLCCEKLNLPNKQKNFYRRLFEAEQKRIQEM